MDRPLHETVNGHLLKPRKYKEKISGKWTNRKAKLQKESWQLS